MPPPAPPPPPLPPRWSAADPYVVLGVPAAAPRPQLRKAYLALALQYHPDKNTNASASGAFAAISRAWKAVSSALVEAGRRGALTYVIETCAPRSRADGARAGPRP